MKYTVRGLGILICILVLAYFAIYMYVVLNKKEIIERVRQDIGEELTGDVKIGNVDISYMATFPSVSVVLENVFITDTMFNKHQHPFFKASRLYASVSVTRILLKKDPLSGIRVDNGQLYVYTDTSGYTNSYLFSGKKKIADTTRARKEKSIIKDITLRNVRLILDNRLRNKLYDFAVNKMECNIKTSDSILIFKTKNSILIHSLAFNTNKGSFGKEALLEGNLNFKYHKSRQQLSFQDLKVNLKGHPFVFTGNFNLAAKNFKLNIATTDVQYELARSMLPKKISTNLSKFKADKPVDEASVEIRGPLNGGEPLIKVQWKAGPINVKTPFFDVSNASFTGSYTNEFVPGLDRNDPNSRVQFHNVKGEWEGIAFTSDNVYIDNLSDPTINSDIKSNFKLSTINELLNSKAIKLNEGQASLNISYVGPLHENTRKNTLINGKVSIDNANISYRPRNIDLQDCNFNILFKNSDVLVTDFRTNVQGNRIEMNGRADNLLSLIKTNPGKISLDWHVYSPSLNLEAFTVLLKKRNRVATPLSTGTGKLNKLANRIDNLLDQANIRVDLKADKLEYRKFHSSNVTASVGLFEDSYNLNKVSLQHAGGLMRITGSLRGVNEYYQEAKVKVDMDNVDINKVLFAFNNFGQDAIESKNIEGKLTTSINVRMDIDRQLKKTPSNIEGDLDFSLKNGALGIISLTNMCLMK